MKCIVQPTIKSAFRSATLLRSGQPPPRSLWTGSQQYHPMKNISKSSRLQSLDPRRELSTSSSATMEDEYAGLQSNSTTGDHNPSERYQHTENTYTTRDFKLELGGVLPEAQLHYHTYGTLNAQRDNVLVVCHALTGNAALHQWWGGLLGPGLPFDTAKYFVVCANILGSCYGSTGPMSIDPRTQKVYGKQFPALTMRDAVRLQMEMLRESWRVSSVAAVVGGSMGGMQALEWSILGASTRFAEYTAHYEEQYPPTATTTTSVSSSKPFVRSAIVIGANASHNAWQIAFGEAQRRAIYADPLWNHGSGSEVQEGLRIARMLAMITYRSAVSYEAKFGRQQSSSSTSATSLPTIGNSAGNEQAFEVQRYMHYQGEKFLSRFDAVTYVGLTQQMDRHDIARGRVSYAEESATAPAHHSTSRTSATSTVASSHTDAVIEVLRSIRCPVLVLGIDSDVLYPLYEQRFMAQHLSGREDAGGGDYLSNTSGGDATSSTNASSVNPSGFHGGALGIIHSENGHDGFLLEQDQVGRFIRDFFEAHRDIIDSSTRRGIEDVSKESGSR